MKGFKIGAQLFAFREHLAGKSKSEIYDFLHVIKDMGYDGVQISGIGEVDAQTAEIYKNVSKNLDLEICATHVSLDALQNNLDWVIDYHKMWECSYLGVGSIPNAQRSLDGALDFAEKYNIIGEKIKHAGLTLFYHNHLFEFQKFSDITLMEILLDKFDERYVEFELDTYFVQAAGANPVDWIYRLDGRMSVIHLKDLAVTEDRPHIDAVGSGNLDWHEILEACKATNVRYAVVELHKDMADPTGGLKKSIDHIRQLI